MLRSLKIRNYAIIRETEIQFHSGLSIITGETGAGKSILMGALGLILGERADSKVILEGSDKCVVEATFEIESYQLQDFFHQQELDYESVCIVRRELTNSGKSRAFINDTPVNLPILKQLGLKLIDIVSQHETLELNEAQFQLNVLDAIADLADLKSNYKATYKAYKSKQNELDSLLQKEAKAKQDEDYLRFVLNEIQELNPQESEQEELEKRLDELSHAETIQQACISVHNAFEGTEMALLDQLKNLKQSLQSAAKHHQGIQALLPRLESNWLDLRDISQELAQISEKTLADPNALNLVEQRLQSIYALQKKHRVQSNAELIELREKFEKQLTEIGSLETQITEASNALLFLEKECRDLGLLLREKRKQIIPEMSKNVNDLLLEVAMPNAHFEIELHELNFEKANAEGIDEVSFLFSANKGFKPQAISKVASGGELSRLMLCIQSLMANKMQLPSVVFDEIDTGISGEAAQKVAAVMRHYSQSHQVIAISHLPQIAAKADEHLYVYKSTEGEQTQTAIKRLSTEERVQEIARMLSGENPSEKVLAAASELIGISLN
ncbi:MAG: DNA repair protein RecN [Bacteroidia bacterium]|nr:DNA repair protein RecN [Bacteroidia bacterium]